MPAWRAPALPGRADGEWNETHLPAFESRPQAPPRLSQAHVDAGRAQYPERAPPARAQAPVRLRPGRRAVSAGAAPLLRLKRRADFLRAARARRQSTPGVLLQARARDGEGDIRVGVTASRKIGNAVARNRAKRRMRALARELLPGSGRPGWDYVLVARPGETLTRPYRAMRAELFSALTRLHGGRQ